MLFPRSVLVETDQQIIDLTVCASSTLYLNLDNLSPSPTSFGTTEAKLIRRVLKSIQIGLRIYWVKVVWPVRSEKASKLLSVHT